MAVSPAGHLDSGGSVPKGCHRIGGKRSVRKLLTPMPAIARIGVDACERLAIMKDFPKKTVEVDGTRRIVDRSR